MSNNISIIGMAIIIILKHADLSSVDHSNIIGSLIQEDHYQY